MASWLATFNKLPRRKLRTLTIYRDACRRSHRVLGTYLALKAWGKRVDCVVVDRHSLFEYLGIKAMRGQRLKWLETDLKDFFPFTKALYRSPLAHGSTYFSRLPFPKQVFDGKMYDQERIEHIQAAGLRTAPITLPTESRMITFLVSAAAGMKSSR